MHLSVMVVFHLIALYTPFSEYSMEEELVPYTNQWEIIGVCLNLTATDLERITREHPDEESHFRGVLTIWKRRGNPPFTWNSIMDVLNSPLVKEHVLAEKLVEKYCS